MMQVRTKDKIFLGVVAPLALLGAYFHFVRRPAVAQVAALKAEPQRLPDVEMFPAERRQLRKRVEEAEAALAAERGEAPRATSVKGDPAAAVAERQDAVLRLFTAAGVSVIHVEPEALKGRMQEASRGCAVLSATGRCAAPEARRFVVEADYTAFQKAFQALAAEQMPVIPEALSLRVGARTCRWEMLLWL